MASWEGFKDWVGGIPVVGSGARAIGFSTPKSGELAEGATEATRQSNENAQAAFAQALAQAQGAGLIATPTVQAPAPVFMPTVAASTVDRTGIVSDPLQQAQAYNYASQGYNATTANAVNAGDSMTGYNASLADAAKVAAMYPAIVGDVNTTVKAPTLEDAALASRVQVGDTTVDPLATEARNESLAAARAIAAGPSSATAQFNAGLDKATAEALSIAAQARGAERAGARREAIIQTALKGGASAEAAAATAAQEENAKRVASASALQSVRGADVSVAQTQAQIDAARSQTQAQLDAAIEQGNAAAINDLKKQKASLDLQAQTVSAQAALQQQSTQAGLSKSNLENSTARALADAANVTNVNLANATAKSKAAADLAAAKNQAEREYAATASGVNVSNAAAKTKAAADTAAALNTAGQQYAGQMSATSLANAQLAATRNENNAQRNLTAATTDAANRTAASTSTAGNALASSQSTATNTLTAGKINTDAALEAEKIRQAAKTSGVQGMNTAATVQGSNAPLVTGAQGAEATAQTKGDTAVIAASADILEKLLQGGAAGGGPTSDARLKSDVKKVSDNEVLDLADKLNSYTWRYKPGVEDSGDNVHGGWMAQELERSALGKKFVSQDSAGAKHVDVLSLAGLMAAAAARSLRKSKENRA